VADLAETEKTGFVTSVPAARPSVCVCWVEEESLCQKVRGTKREEAPAKVVVSNNNAVDSGEVKRKAGDAFSFFGLERTGGGLGQVPGWLGDQVRDS